MIPSAKPGIILDIGRDRQLSAGLRAVDDERLELCPRRVDRGGQARPGRNQNHNFSFDIRFLTYRYSVTLQTAEKFEYNRYVYSITIAS